MRKKAVLVNIRFKHAALFAYLLLLVPIVIFFFGWLHWYYALAFTLILGGAFAWLYRCDYVADHERIHIPIKHFIPIVALIGFWVLMSGNCGFSAGLFDIPWRNVILSDLIDYSWPVYYAQSGYALAYYIVFWMIPALVGKAFGWGAALFALWLYQTCICVTAVFLAANLIKAEKVSTYWLVTVIFMLWSGLNLVGAAVMQMWGHNYYVFGLESNESYCDYFFRNGQATNFYYRSNTDCIEESYNQIVLWLAVPLLLKNRKMHSFIFLDLLLLPFSPWAAIGLIPLMIVIGVGELRGYLRADGGKVALVKTLRGVFSPANVLGLGVCLFVFGTYFLSGSHMTGSSSDNSGSTGSFGLLSFWSWDGDNWRAWIIFCLCEFGVFALLIARKFKRDALFWATVIWLALIPFIWMGTISGRDFCMNASLPGIFIMMIYMLRYLTEEVQGKPLGLRNLLIVIVLTVACASPVMEMCYQVQLMYAAKSLSVQTNTLDYTTFDGLALDRIDNFVCSDPDSTFFFRYLAR
jgi:hypothetical protein